MACMDISYRSLSAEQTPRIVDMLGAHEALILRQTLSAREAQSLTHAVYAARDEWSPAFEATQFSLGKAFYVEYEEGREEEYFLSVEESNAVVENYLPGMQEFMLELFTLATRQPAVLRESWCGPGVHIFPANGLVARQGGEPHFDLEGLTDEDIAHRVPALTMVLMLQAPEQGGGLAVWDTLFDGRFEYDLDFDTLPAPDIAFYGVGDCVIIDSYRLHQIQPFTGSLDRISLTAHGLLHNGVWHVWF